MIDRTARVEQPEVQELEDKIHSVLVDFENTNDCGILLKLPHNPEGQKPKRFELFVSQPHKPVIASGCA